MRHNCQTRASCTTDDRIIDLTQGAQAPDQSLKPVTNKSQLVSNVDFYYIQCF